MPTKDVYKNLKMIGINQTNKLQCENEWTYDFHVPNMKMLALWYIKVVK
jgi:hypothetical protein